MYRSSRGFLAPGAVALFLLLTGNALAQISGKIRYQGHIVDSKGTSLEGPYDLTFRLYTAETGGTKLWEERHNIEMHDGQFSVLLGSFKSAELQSIDWTQSCWLSLQINSESELTPRQQITSVPLAITAERLSGAITTKGSNVGIGTATPSATFHLVNDGEFKSLGGDTHLIRRNGWGAHLHLVSDRTFRITSTHAPDAPEGGSKFVIADETAGATRIAVDSNGNVGIGTSNPNTIFAVQQSSPTDPIADSWTIYACDRRHKDLLRTVPPSGYLNRLKAVELYEWRRKPEASDEEAKEALQKEQPTATELDAKRRELVMTKAQLPKFTAKRIGMAIDDTNVPAEILALNADGTKAGIDLLAYVGYLHAALKEMALKLDELDSRLGSVKPAR